MKPLQKSIVISSVAIATLATSNAAVVLNAGEFAATAADLSEAVSNVDLATGTTVSDIHAGGGNGASGLLIDGGIGNLGFNQGGVNGSNGGGLTILIDLGSSQSLGIVNVFSAGSGADNIRQNQIYTVFGSNDPASVITDTSTFTPLASVDTVASGPGNLGFGLTSVDLQGASFQFLLFETAPVSSAGGGETSIIHEIDVFAAVPEPSSLALLAFGLFPLLKRQRRV